MTNFPNYHYQNQGGNNGPKARYNSNLIMSEDAISLRNKIAQICI